MVGTQHAEAGSEEKQKQMRKSTFLKILFLKLKMLVFLIFLSFFRSCLSMLCSIFANFGNQSLKRKLMWCFFAVLNQIVFCIEHFLKGRLASEIQFFQKCK